jgi:outer membrane protein OmpA-like peptidoglycan-associated protein
MGADRFATESFHKAETSLTQAEAYQTRKAGRKPVAMTAREAVQMAEDSRAIGVKRQEDEALTAERTGASARTAAAQSETDRVTREAEAARIAAQLDATRLRRENDAKANASLVEVERLKRESDLRETAAKTEADRLKAENESKMAAAGADTERLRAENAVRLASAGAEADRLRAENESKMAAAGAEADRLKRENDAQRAAGQANLDEAARQKAKLEAEKVEMRVLLLSQFNAILQTRDSPRGLIVNMSDVLFDTGKFSLRPVAREKLAKLAGIVAGHPGLRLAVEGYTDSVGGDNYNQQLSENRSDGVRTYLTQQGMPESSITAKGFGKGQPVASNDTAAGRQQNRRVELVISGEVIGTPISGR